jgi:hypothetical protein
MRIKNQHYGISVVITVLLALAFLARSIPSSEIKREITGTPIGWTEDIRITDFSNNDVNVAITVDENDFYLVWERTVVVSSDYEVYFVKSNDSGESWGSPQQISNSGIYATDPDIKTNNSHLHVVWSDWKTPDWEIFYRNSNDGGKTWNPEKKISIDDGNNSEGPRIAVNNSSIHVIWVDARLAQTEVFYKRSIDGGITWDDGLGNPDVDRRITHDLSGAAPAGIEVYNSNLHVLFSDDRDGSPDVYYIRSIDNGATWDDGLGNINEERKLTSNSTWHMASRMAIYGPTIHVVWVDQVWPGPVYYLYYRNSTDNGVTWNAIQLLTGPSPIIASPDIAAWENRVDVVWDDMKDDGSTTEIYYKNSTDGGVSWGGDIRLTYNESYDSLWPRVSTYQSTVHATWYDERDGNYEIYYKRSPDFPQPTGTNLTLSPGWNLISFPYEQSKLNDTMITNASSLIDATGCTMASYWNASTQSYISYIAGFHNYTDPENFPIVEDDGVWVWWPGASNITFIINGSDPGNRNVHLLPGWNIVAYKNLTIDDVESTWAGQVECGMYDDICYWNGSTFIHYIFPGTVMELVPTRGYFIWSDNDTYLNY